MIYDNNCQYFIKAYLTATPINKNGLTRWVKVTHICVRVLGHRCLRWWLAACLLPSRYVHQHIIIVNWKPGYKFWRGEITIKINTFSFKTRARLRRVAPLGRPRSVYKGNVESSFLSQNNSQMTLKIKVNDIHFRSQLRESQDAFLVQMWWFLLKFNKSYHTSRSWPMASIFFIPAESVSGCMLGANLVILAQICDEWSHGQAKFPGILSQNGLNDLEDHSQWPPFSTPAKNISCLVFGANLAIPAQICDELSCGQVKVCRRMEERTDRRMIRQYPFVLKAKG